MSLSQTVDRFVKLVQSHESLPPELATEAAALRDRLSTGQFHLAVLGQFKRGKSTLINALLGTEVLPSGVLPVTLVPVFLRFGPEPDLEIHYNNGHGSERQTLDHLGMFVNEANNPKNQKDVNRVDLFYPSELLRTGVVLIDTPGVGSTLQHNTDTTLDFLPRCDAAIVVLSADPPITAVEVEFLQQLRSHVARFFFVLNKIDYLDEGSIAVARQFLVDTLQARVGIESPSIWPVSARRGLTARLNRDHALWLDSGMADLEQSLLTFAANDKQDALVQAVQKKVIDLAGKAQHLLALEQQAARMPLDELDLKIAAFHRYAEAARNRRYEIKDKLAGDTARLKRQLEQAAEEMRPKAEDELLHLAETLNVPTRDQEQLQRFREAVTDYFDRERQAARDQFGGALSAVLTDLAQRAGDVREGVRRDAATLLEIPYFPGLPEEATVELMEPAWTIDHLPFKLTPTWDSGWWVSKARQQQRQNQQRQKLVHEIAVRNVGKIRYWILRMIEESTRRFQYGMTRELEETIQQIDRALLAGQQLHQSQAENQHAVMAELDACRERLDEICQDMAPEVPCR